MAGEWKIGSVFVEVGTRGSVLPELRQIQEQTKKNLATLQAQKTFYTSGSGQAALREELRLTREIGQARLVAERGRLGAFAANTAGARTAAAATFLGTSALAGGYEFERFKQASADLGAVVGREMLPYLRELTRGVRSTADWFVNLPAPLRKTVGATVAVSAGLLILPPILTRLAAGATAAAAALARAGQFGLPGEVGSRLGHAGVAAALGYMLGGPLGGALGFGAGMLGGRALSNWYAGQSMTRVAAGSLARGALRFAGPIGLGLLADDLLLGGRGTDLIGSGLRGLKHVGRNTIGRLFMSGDERAKANEEFFMRERVRYGTANAYDKARVKELDAAERRSSLGAKGMEGMGYKDLVGIARDVQTAALKMPAGDPDRQTADNTRRMADALQQLVAYLGGQKAAEVAYQVLPGPGPQQPVPRGGRDGGIFDLIAGLSGGGR